jgi:glutathione reductase (NADPH)
MKEREPKNVDFVAERSRLTQEGKEMAPEREYDVVVIGSGPAGGTIAPKCRSAGRSVALVEAREFGGVCPNRGCNPKKVLLAAAEAINRSRDMHERGIWGEITIDWPELMRFKRSFTDPVSERKELEFKNLGIDVYHGAAHFVDRQSVRVEDQVLSANHFAVVAGMVPRRLNIEGEHLAITSEEFLKIDQLPASIILIGGGFISFEFAHIAARAGAKVTILEMTDTVLPEFDQDLVRVMVEASQDIGIDVHTNMPINTISREDSLLKVHVEEERDHEFAAAAVVNAAGRVPNVDGLKLEQADIRSSPKGIIVNEYLQSVSNAAVYAAGDVANTPFALTPVASMEGAIVAENIVRGNIQKPDYRGIPQVVYTVPPLASAGMLEEDVKKQGIIYESRFFNTSSWFSSKRIGLRHSGAKVLIAKNSKRILGAHLFGHCAEEVINIFAMAIKGNLTVHNLERMVWTYPSSAYEIRYML